jgi:hypothetical protein
MDDIYKLGLTKWHPEIKLKNWTRKKDCIKVKKKIINNWIWYSYSSSKLLKINQKNWNYGKSKSLEIKSKKNE